MTLAVDVIKIIFGGYLDLPKIHFWKKFVLMTLYLVKNASQMLITFKLAHSCCFT